MNIFALELTRIPNVSLKTMLRLAKTLLKSTAPGDSEAIQQAAADLQALVDLVHAALLARARAGAPERALLEVRFDLAVDALWMLLRRRLDDPQVYVHEGLELLTPERAASIDLEVARDEALRARQLIARVFGSTAMSEIVKQSLVEQVESTAALLRLIEQDELVEDIAEIVGKRLLETLKVCQAQYEDMVDDRLRRQRGLEHSLTQLRQDLRWTLTAYVTAVQSLVRPKLPESGTAVLAHLQPILSLRESLARTGSEAAAVEELEELEQLETVEELEQLEQGEQGDAEQDAAE